MSWVRIILDLAFLVLLRYYEVSKLKGGLKHHERGTEKKGSSQTGCLAKKEDAPAWQNHCLHYRARFFGPTTRSRSAVGFREEAMRKRDLNDEAWSRLIMSLERQIDNLCSAMDPKFVEQLKKTIHEHLGGQARIKGYEFLRLILSRAILSTVNRSSFKDRINPLLVEKLEAALHKIVDDFFASRKEGGA